MRRAILIVVLAWMNSVCPGVRADLTPVTISQFAPGDPVITFETGTTALPVIPGVTFLQQPPSSTSPWFNSDAEFNSFGPGFGAQTWTNLVSTTYSGLGLDLATPVQAIGGYVAKVPNFADQSPATVTVELLGGAQNSLGTATITLNATVNSPVFFGFTASAPIAGFRMTGDTPGFFGVDNFIYGSLQSVPSVPEPSSALAVGFAALAGLGAWARKRRAASRAG
jgi:hypothetical protein